MLEQFRMGTVLFGDLQMIFYILAVEGLLLCILQMRTNGLLRKSIKVREQKKERMKQLKEEIKTGESDIPVVKFEEPKRTPKQSKEPQSESKEPQRGFDSKELAVLQDMLAEYFG